MRKQTITIKPKLIFALLLMMALFFCVSTVSAANTIYVNASGSDASGDGSVGNPYHTIQKGIDNINSKGTIYLANGTYKDIGNTNITINKSMSIIGESQTRTIINGTGTNWIFNIQPWCNFIIQNLTLTNTTKIEGGAIANQYGTCTVSDCTFTSNTAIGYGGAIWTRGTCTVSNCSFTGNNANSGGGAIFNDVSCTCTVTGCTFTSNTATNGAGAIFNYKGTFTVTNCNFTNNTADDGGAIYNTLGTFTVTNSTFTGNTATRWGGAIVNIGDCNVSNCTFTGNNATRWCGAIYNGDTCTVSNCTFTNNTAMYNGGAICNYNNSTCTVDNCTFTNNTSTNDYGRGGAIYNVGTCTLNGCTFTTNIANNYGGAIYNSVNCTVGNCTFTNNTANNSNGGAIYNDGGTCNVHFSRFYNNNAIQGNAFYNDGGSCDANYNWWGSNNPNWNSLIIGPVNHDNWVILTINATPNSINNNGNSTITADFNHINGGTDLNDGNIPDGPITFNIPWGSFTNSGTNHTFTANTTNGTITTTFYANEGTVNTLFNPVKVTATADNYTTNNTESAYISIGPTSVTVNPVNGHAGQNINITAQVTDSQGYPVNEGSVIFTINGTHIGTAPVNNGTTILNWTIPNWNTGNYTILAEYTGTTNFLTSNNTENLTINPTPTNITVNPANGHAGQNINITANINSQGYTVNEGTIQFTINGTHIGTAPVNNGTTILNWTIPNWNTGNYTILAEYTGTSNFLTSNNTENLTINPTPTNITVNPANGYAGQNINITANINSQGYTVNEGTIQFTINGTHIGTAPVNNGTTILNWTIPNWNTGNYTILAEYTGTTNFLTSNNTENLTINPTPTNITINPANGYAGQNINITANINSQGYTVNEGTIQFTINGTHIGTASVNNGTTILNWTIPNWNTGNYTILAEYTGTTNFLTSNNTENLTINPTPTNITINPANGYAGQNINITANINSQGYTVNEGTIQFTINGTHIGTASVNNGTTILNWTIPNWNTGNYTILAEYTGTTNFLTSNNTENLTINPTPTNITINPANGYAGQNINITANINSQGYTVNEGTIQFTINGTHIGTASVNNGTTILNWTIPNWNTGNYTILAEYTGTTNFLTSNNTENLTINPTPTNLTINPANGYAGQNINITANINSQGYTVNEGTIQFTINGTHIGTASVNNGTTILNWTIPNWNTGNYTILAEYTGTSNFLTSNNTENLTINPTPTNLTINPVNNYAGKNVTLTAQVTDSQGYSVNEGSVIFTIKGSIIGIVSVNNGESTMNWTIPNDFKAGNYNILAEYTGTTNYATSNYTEKLTVNPSADLYMKITSDKTKPKLGETFTLTYKLGNNGPDPAENVKITIALPEGFEISQITGDGTWIYNANNNTITWTMTNVPVGDPYLYISGYVSKTGEYVFSSSVSSETYNINSQGVIPITINAVQKINATNNTTKTIPMQDTGLPITGLILAILAVIGGIVSTKNK